VDGQEEMDRYRRVSLGAQLARSARKDPDRPAFIAGGKVRTFGELDARVEKLARVLVDAGVQPGERVAVLMTNSFEMVEACWAAFRVGAILVPLNFRLVAHELAYQMRDSEPVALIADSALFPATEEGRNDLPPMKALVTFGVPVAGTAPPGTLDFEQAIATAGDEPVDVDVPETSPAVIAYTSGTTGPPKGAVLTHFGLVTQTMGAMVKQGINGRSDVWYVSMPLFHIGGIVSIMPYLMTGGHSVLVGSGNFSAQETVADLERHGVTGCSFIGMQWDEICDEINRTKPKLALRRVSWGAAGVPDHVLHKMSATLPGIPIASFFGQTEMSPVTCMLDASEFETKRGSVGRPVMNVEARIVDENMQEVPVGEIGEMVYRGPTVMQGYWNNPKANEEAFRGGWFHSGDLCRVDEDGCIYVMDRKHDMIISGGENIYSPEVEGVISSHPGVAEAVVIGVPHPKWGETPVAFIVPADPDAPPSFDDIIEWTRTRLASYKKPTAVITVDAMPRNATGKVVKPRLRERYAASVELPA
jgi:fatty-acyl-CoA synthase